MVKFLQRIPAILQARRFEDELARLAETSPHLLADIGADRPEVPAQSAAQLPPGRV